MNVKIRTATDKELDLLRELGFQTFPEELQEYERKHLKDLRKRWREIWDTIVKRKDNTFYVAEGENQEILGFIWIGFSRRPFSGMKIAWIYDIVVAQEYRGKGIGEKLMQKAIQHCREKGHAILGLFVNWKNTAARRLYEKLGFHPEHVEMYMKI